MLRAYYLLLICLLATSGAALYRFSSSTPTAPTVSANQVIEIWPEQPPGPPMDVGEEKDVTKDSDDLIAGRRIIKLTNVDTPEIHVFLPPAEKRNGSAVVICPGGGFSILAWDLEGTEVADWLNSIGVAAIVLKYRVPTRAQDPMWLASAQDAQRAMSLVRAKAQDWGIKSNRVALMGFSAGGVATLKTCLATKRYYPEADEADKESYLPDRAILIYSGGFPESAQTANLDGFGVTSKTPPMFIAHAYDDFVPVEGTANMLLALKKADVSCELHVYDAGGHGYGLREVDDLPVTTWHKACQAWLKRAGWLES